MRMTLTSVTLAALVLGAGAIGAGSASAASLGGGLDPAIATGSDLAPMVQDARWVCGPYGHCHWAPNFYRPGFYNHGPRFHRGFFGGRRWRRF